MRKRDGMATRCLEFAVLCASRSGEVRGATWDEIDLEARIWKIPGARMKMERDHRIPLTEEAVALLKSTPRVSGSPYVFPAVRGGALSDMSLSALMRRMQEAEVKAGRKGGLTPIAGVLRYPTGCVRFSGCLRRNVAMIATWLKWRFRTMLATPLNAPISVATCLNVAAP